MSRGSLVLILAAVVTAPGFARGQDEDLAVVKKAVATSEAQKGEVTTPKPGRGTAKWLKVRVNERTGKRVVVNLPLNLVRALGDDWPVEWGCWPVRAAHARCALKMSEMLATLEAGQTLVEVNGDGDTVRVWVE